MSDLTRLFELIKLFMIGGFALAMTFLILLALPKSRLREFLLPFAKLAFVVLCGIYAISPLDLVPEMLFGPIGLLDDAVAVGAGILTAASAVQGFKAPARPRDRSKGSKTSSNWVDDPFDI
jgi:uncharacterized membrane protein YkvA (DUF1232 family)